MHILWIKKTSFGVVIVNLIMVCGSLILSVLAIFAPGSFLNRAEANTAFPSGAFPFITPFITPLPEEQKNPASTYGHWIRVACRKHSLDPALVTAVIHAESQFDPKAISPKGAMGLMQLSPIVTRELGIDDPFDPRINIDGGVRYLKGLLDTFDGDRKLALAAYNAGPTQVYRHNGVPPFKDTKKYIKQVFRYQTFYQKTPIS